eukprot:3645608-Pleurochrysis_carterae.AAC.3
MTEEEGLETHDAPSRTALHFCDRLHPYTHLHSKRMPCRIVTHECSSLTIVANDCLWGIETNCLSRGGGLHPMHYLPSVPHGQANTP